MAKYNIKWREDVLKWEEVEATSEDEAREKLMSGEIDDFTVKDVSYTILDVWSDETEAKTET